MKTSEALPLLENARNAAKHSHSPYSKFRVGAALLCADGQVITGCNVENASYGLTLCAERNAITTAIAAGIRSFKALAVVAEGTLPYPCGACRQVLAEFCEPAFPVLIADARALDAFEQHRLDELLPKAFGR